MAQNFRPPPPAIVVINGAKQFRCPHPGCGRVLKKMWNYQSHSSTFFMFFHVPPCPLRYSPLDADAYVLRRRNPLGLPPVQVRSMQSRVQVGEQLQGAHREQIPQRERFESWRRFRWKLDSWLRTRERGQLKRGLQPRIRLLPTGTSASFPYLVG